MQDAQELFIFYIQLSQRLLKLTKLQVIIHRHLVYKVGLFFNKCGYAIMDWYVVLDMESMNNYDIWN